MKIKTTLFRSLFVLALYAGQVSAQSDVSELIKSSPEDATKLASAYLKPLFKGFGVGLNSGWNNTAQSKNLLRFDLRFGVTGAVVPTKDEIFDVTQIGLSNNVRPTNPTQTRASTLAGPENTQTQLTVYDSNNQALETFTLPEGTGLNLIPAPQLQATLGLVKGLDFTLRAMPKIDLGDDLGSIGMIGGGVKLELLPLLAGKAGKILPFDLAVALGYTQFTYNVPLEVNAPGNAVPSSPSQSTDFSNQRIDAKFSGVNTEIILSKRLAVFTPFISLGYNSAKTDVGMKGNFPIVDGVNTLGQRTYTVFTNPININQTDISGVRTNLGFQLNLAFLRLYGSYTMAEYNAFNAGVGFGIGK